MCFSVPVGHFVLQLEQGEILGVEGHAQQANNEQAGFSVWQYTPGLQYSVHCRLFPIEHRRSNHSAHYRSADHTL